MRKMSWLLAFSLAWLVIVVPAAMADELSNGEEFSNASVQGPYGFGFDGTLSGNRIAVVGQFIANGQGFLAGQRTFNTGGPVLEQSFTCKYSVSGNGTGTAGCTINPGGSEERYAFVLVNKGAAAHLIATFPAGAVLHATAMKQ